MDQNKIEKLATQFKTAMEGGDTLEEITEIILNGLIEEIPKHRPELTKEEVEEEAAAHIIFIYKQLGIIKDEVLH